MKITGIDTGGTFTDFIYKENNEWKVFKVLSTPLNPAEAVLEGLKKIEGGSKTHIIHGSTVATNAILERKGAATALITNKGFEDVIEIGRQNRSRLYDLYFRKNRHLVSHELRFGIRGRILHTGEEIELLDEVKAKEVVEVLKDLGVESVAVCFLFSYLNPLHEQKIKALLEPLGIAVSVSHEILSEFREYERTSTTVVNAYVMPRVKHYTGHLTENLDLINNSLSIMQSNGGRITAATAMEEPVRTILSGPAGGVAGAFITGKTAGHKNLITFDMGGTSTDVSLIHNGLSITTDMEIAGCPVKIPMLDIHTVGAGGGSMAYLDSGGALKVGPKSAGSMPGPICYGMGEKITVTDANLFLGRLIPE